MPGRCLHDNLLHPILPVSSDHESVVIKFRTLDDQDLPGFTTIESTTRLRCCNDIRLLIVGRKRQCATNIEIGGALLRWGLIPFWAKDRKTSYINARAETLLEKPAFRSALQRRRCLILADGYFEWKTVGKIKSRHGPESGNKKASRERQRPE